MPDTAGRSQTPIPKQMRAKKLPCSHSFHLHCLRSWLERQQACPTCRASVLPEEDRELERRQREREKGSGKGCRQITTGVYSTGSTSEVRRPQTAEARRARERERARSEREESGGVGATASREEEEQMLILRRRPRRRPQQKRTQKRNAFESRD